MYTYEHIWIYPYISILYAHCKKKIKERKNVTKNKEGEKKETITSCYYILICSLLGEIYLNLDYNIQLSSTLFKYVYKTLCSCVFSFGILAENY